MPDELLLGPSDNLEGSSPNHPMTRSFESGEEADFDNSTGMLGDLDGHEDEDHGR